MLILLNEPEVCCAPERSRFPSRAGASGSHHLPWALPRVLQVIPKIKRVGGEAIGAPAADAAVSAERMRAALSSPAGAPALLQRSAAGRRRGSGRAGKPSRDTGRRRRANRNGTVKADATGSASKAGNHQSQKQLTTPRG